MPPKVNNAFVIKTDTLHNSLKQLHYLAISYQDSIFVPLNKRISAFKVNGKLIKTDQKAMIRNVDYLCLECDDANFKTQMQLLNNLKPFVKTAIFTGNKSIHIWIACNIVTYNSPSKGISHDPKQLLDVKEFILNECHKLNLTKEHYDLKVLNDYSTWLRLPNTTRKYKAQTRIVYHNSNSKVFKTKESSIEYTIDDLNIDDYSCIESSVDNPYDDIDIISNNSKEHIKLSNDNVLNIQYRILFLSTL